jgi:hypothetical protein
VTTAIKYLTVLFGVVFVAAVGRMRWTRTWSPFSVINLNIISDGVDIVASSFMSYEASPSPRHRPPSAILGQRTPTTTTYPRNVARAARIQPAPSITLIHSHTSSQRLPPPTPSPTLTSHIHSRPFLRFLKFILLHDKNFCPVQHFGGSLDPPESETSRSSAL